MLEPTAGHRHALSAINSLVAKHPCGLTGEEYFGWQDDVLAWSDEVLRVLINILEQNHDVVSYTTKRPD